MVAEAGIEPALRGLWGLQGRRPFPPHDYVPLRMVQRWVWSARGDSNPDLHGLNVPRLPIAPRADGGHVVPPGGLEPPPHGLRARRAALTLQRESALERMAGFEPAPQGLEGPQANRYPTFALVRPTGIEPVPPRWQRGMLPAHPGRTWTGVVHRPIDFCHLSKTPLVASSSYRPYWRQRQDSNPDPRDLEARMLPLHHAAGRLTLSTVSKTEPPRDLARFLSRA